MTMTVHDAPAAQRGGGWRHHPARPVLIALCLLAVAAAASWSLHDWLHVARPDRARLISDSAAYADVARSLARHQGYIDRLVTPLQVRLSGSGPPQPAAAWAPLYPTLTSFAFALWGARDRVPMVVNACGFLAATWMLYLLGRTLLGPGLAWMPPLLLCLHPRTLELASDGLSEGWFTAFLVAAVLLLLAPRRRTSHVAAAAFALALAQLTRVNAVCLLPVLAWLAVRPASEGDSENGAPPQAPGAGRPAASGGGSADDPQPAGLGGAALFVVVFGLALLPWLIYRLDIYGSPFFELQRYNLLYDLGPWHGAGAFRSLLTPEPLTYALGHPLQLAAKLATGIVKSAALIPLSFFAPLELALVLAGLVVMFRRPRQRRAALAFLALTLVQLLVGSATLLDARLWQPAGVLLWIPVAAGAGAAARRLSADWRGLALGALFLLVGVLPYGQRCLAAYLAPGLGRARFTEEEARALGAWTRLLVPDGEAVLTGEESLVWYADRPVVWRPLLPAEVAPLRALSGVRYALWRSSPGGGGEHEAWRRYFDTLLAHGALHRSGELRLESSVFCIATWEQ